MYRQSLLQFDSINLTAAVCSFIFVYAIPICPDSPTNCPQQDKGKQENRQVSSASKPSASFPSKIEKKNDSGKNKVGKNWTSWRGPLGTGEAIGVKPPVSWSETDNVRWKVTLPGKGHSTPIVWEDSVVITYARPVGKPFQPIKDQRPGSHDNLEVSSRFQFGVAAYHRLTGKLLWNSVCETRIPHEGGHRSASLASASPVTDGKRIYAFFGSAGLFTLDYSGKILWKKKFPKMHSKHGHGEGSSPVLWKQTLFINWDEEGQSYVHAINTKDGGPRWKKAKNEKTSWSSPIIAKVGDRFQLITAGTNKIRGYDASSGHVLWFCRGLSANVATTPVYQDGILVVGSSYDIRRILVLDIRNAEGDITDSKHLLWKTNQRTPYIPSPLVYRDRLYYLRHYQGILTVADLKSGLQEIGPFRIRGFSEIYSSPSAADGKIFITSRSGITAVLDSDQMPRIHGMNQVKDKVSASLAFSEDMIFIRGEKKLYCIQEQTKVENSNSNKNKNENEKQ